MGRICRKNRKFWSLSFLHWNSKINSLNKQIFNKLNYFLYKLHKNKSTGIKSAGIKLTGIKSTKFWLTENNQAEFEIIIKKIPKLTNPEIQPLRYKSMQYINSQILSKIDTY